MLVPHQSFTCNVSYVPGHAKPTVGTVTHLLWFPVTMLAALFLLPSRNSGSRTVDSGPF